MSVSTELLIDIPKHSATGFHAEKDYYQAFGFGQE
jgi:hypothetical protein